MAKKVNIGTIEELNKLVESITKSVLKEDYGYGDDKIIQFLEELCKKMGASFAEFDEESGHYVIMSKSILDLRYIFEPDPNTIVKLIGIEGIEEFKQAFNEISVLSHELGGKNLTTLK